MARTRIFPLVVFVGSLSACTSTPDRPVPDETFALRASWIDTYVTEAGTTEVPKNLSRTDIVAVSAFDGAAYPAEGTADGALVVRELPRAPYFLRVDQQPLTYFAGEVDEVDIGRSLFGRPDLLQARSDATRINFEVENLKPWENGDDLLLHSFDAAISVDLSFHAEPPLPDGATRWQQQRSWTETALPANLIDGDQTYAAQLEERSNADGDEVLVLENFAVLAPFTMFDGATNTIHAALSAMPINAQVSIDWRRSTFRDLVDGAGRSAMPGEQTLELNAMPNAGLMPEGSALLVYLRRTEHTTDLLDARVLANPLPAMDLVEQAGAAFSVSTSINGATPLLLNVFSRTARTFTPGEPLEPIISHPRALHVNGEPVGTEVGAEIAAEIAGCGETPELSWDPPAIGDANLYLLSIGELSVADGKTTRTFVGRVYTSETHVTIPPGILQRGSSYAIRMTAFHQGDGNKHSTPFRRALPEGAAEMLIPNLSP